MMKKRTVIFLGVGVLLTAANLFLTLHTDSKVSRTSFISKWDEARTETLTETLETAGVVTPAEEHPIYYDSEQGGFKEFLVKKGEPVREGTRLFEYNSLHIDADRLRLEGEIDKLRREVALIDDQIEQLEYLQNVATGTEVEGLTAQALVGVTIEKEIYDLEQKQGRLLKDIEEYDDQLDALDEGREIDFTSVVSGTVKEINYQLENPIMTIISDTPKVSGLFAEGDLAQVEEGMEVYVNSELFGQTVPGTLTEISSHPKGEPSVEAESQFAFEVVLAQDGMVPGESGGYVWEDDETAGKIVHGAHVDVTVVTNKVEEAVTVSNQQLQKGSYLYVLTQTGRIERRDIKLGLEVDDKVEIVEGLEKDEIVVIHPNQVALSDAPFITSLMLLKLDDEPFKEETKMDLLKAIGVGFSKK